MENLTHDFQFPLFFWGDSELDELRFSRRAVFLNGVLFRTGFCLGHCTSLSFGQLLLGAM